VSGENVPNSFLNKKFNVITSSSAQGGEV